MDLTALPILIGLCLLALCSAVCSGTETALFGLTYHDRLRLRRISPQTHRIVTSLTSRPRSLLVTLMLANNIVNVAYFVLGAALMFRAHNPVVGVVLNAVSVLLLIAVGEVGPKVVAGSARVTACRVVARPAMLLVRALSPICTAIERLAIAPLTRLVRPAPVSTPLSIGELSALVELGRREGAIDPGEQEVLAQVIHLGTLRVRDAMTPRTRMTWLDAAATAARISSVVASTRLTKIPVRRKHDAGDDASRAILGLLNTKAFLAAHAQGLQPRTGDFIEPVRYVPQSARLDALLEHFRTTRTQFALCVSEHGDVVGSVRIEDVAERLVSEIPTDEPGGTTTPQEEIREIEPGRWVVPGRMNVKDWAGIFGQVADHRVTTVAGLVQARLGRLPAVGDRITLGNVRIKVESMAGRVVDRVAVSLDESTGDGVPSAHAAGREPPR